MSDLLGQSLNAPPGRLAEIVVKRLPKATSPSGLPDELRSRLDRLVAAPGKAGRLARVRLAAEVSYLFERAPDWTSSKIIPLFLWSSPEACDAWQARKYSRYIGSPRLVELMKKPFLELFGRNDVTSDELRTFGDWLAWMIIVNRVRSTDQYPLSATEARSALRKAGSEALVSVGHRLAIEMEAAKPEEKAQKWRTIIGPTFQSIWPLDVELQSHASTFKLVQILRATGEAFPEAADVILPFIRPDDPRSHSTLFSLARAPDALYVSSPAKMLDLVAAVAGDAAPGAAYSSLAKALKRIHDQDPSLANTRKFQKLLSRTGE